MTPVALRIAGARNPRALVLRALAAAPRLGAGAAALMVVQQVAEFTVPVIIGLAIDHGIAARDFGSTLGWACLLVADFLVLVLAAQFGSRLGLRAVESVQHRLRLAVVGRVLAPTGIAGARGVGELLSIAGSDVARLSRAVLITVYPVAEIAALGYAAIALTLIWWPLGVAVFLGGLALVLTMELIGRPFRQRSEHEQERIAGVTSVAADTLTGAATLRGFGARDWALARYAAANDEALDATKRSRSSEQRFVALSRALSALLVVGVAVAAAGLAFAGEITIGQLVIVVGLVQLVIGPLEALSINLAAVWLAALASAARVLALMQEPAARPEPAERVGGVGALPAGGLPAGALPAAALPAGARPLPALEIRLGERGHAGHRARQVIAVDRGQLVGVVAGSSLASALVDELRRCDTETTVRVMLDGDDAAKLRSDALAARLVVASGRIAGASLPPAPAAARLAAQAVEAPHSGGEHQRAALAAALASPAPVLVLHEPTSAVDPVTERLIADALRTATAGRAVLIVTTAPALLAVTDEVHLLEEHTVSRGSHHDLLGIASYRGLLR
ncbi:ABC transporter ATP-binding protein [Leucobacter albus]|uniref:ABC transporter ATP-binding protein n=1 Tax=Leucobacter albus TaxID=272210 RepID=A0ABW3TS50_9MICO